MKDAHMVLWWVPAGHRPSVEEALARLDTLRGQGPTPAAFTFRQSFSAPESGAIPTPIERDEACPAG